MNALGSVQIDIARNAVRSKIYVIKPIDIILRKNIQQKKKKLKFIHNLIAFEQETSCFAFERNNVNHWVLGSYCLFTFTLFNNCLYLILKN